MPLGTKAKNHTLNRVKESDIDKDERRLKVERLEQGQRAGEEWIQNSVIGVFLPDTSDKDNQCKGEKTRLSECGISLKCTV